MLGSGGFGRRKEGLSRSLVGEGQGSQTGSLNPTLNANDVSFSDLRLIHGDSTRSDFEDLVWLGIFSRYGVIESLGSEDLISIWNSGLIWVALVLESVISYRGFMNKIIWWSSFYSLMISGWRIDCVWIANESYGIWWTGVSPNLFSISGLRFRLALIRLVMGIYLIRFATVFRCGCGFCSVITLLWSSFLLSLERLFSVKSFCGSIEGGSQVLFLWRNMAQLALNKGKSSMVRTETVTISSSVLAHRIQQFSMTLIGRLMNPACQNMESLIANFPKIWKLEEKVVGADLGQGVFQFNFEDEEDLLSVLQNGPYHFDSWMVSLVRWEPIISSSYPSVINFWVKVSGIPMHLWEVATLEAIGKKLGKIQEIDEETGSICVAVNGFNPVIFNMVVPFATGDEVVVSLEYEKITGVCGHCSRLTHDAKVCPALLKVESGQGPAEKVEHRGGQRHLHGVKQEPHNNAGGWEKPRKHAKRALDFQSADHGDQGYFPQQFVGGSGLQGQRQYERSQGLAWGQRRSLGEVVSDDGFRRGFQKGSGESSGKGSGFHLNRKGSGPTWPKPLFKVKQISAVKQASLSLDANLGVSGSQVLQETRDQEGGDPKGDAGVTNDMDFEVENDDLLEDGEFGVTDKSAHNAVQKEVDLPVQRDELHPSHGADIHGAQGSDVQVESGGDSQGDGHKQKQLGKSGIDKVDGKPSDGGRPSKKGMGALPKPPART